MDADALDADTPGIIEFPDGRPPEKPPVEKPPIDSAHTGEPKNDPGEEKQYERQTKRPRCPRCDKLMTAAQTRGPITYYVCAYDECPERVRIPVTRREMIDAMTGKLKYPGGDADQNSVAARPDMKGTS
jgi:hypothetical protein